MGDIEDEEEDSQESRLRVCSSKEPSPEEADDPLPQNMIFLSLIFNPMEKIDQFIWEIVCVTKFTFSLCFYRHPEVVC